VTDILSEDGNTYGRFQVRRMTMFRWEVWHLRKDGLDCQALNLRFWRNINACRVAQALFLADRGCLVREQKQ